MSIFKARLVINKKDEHHLFKWAIRILIASIFAVFLESLGIEIDEDGTVVPVLFSIIGIIMPIAVSQSLAMPFDGINNQQYVDGIRESIDYVTKCFIYLLVVAAVFFIKPYPDFEIKYKCIKMSLYVLSDYYIFGILVYYCFNFIKLVDLKNKLSDELRKNRVEKEFIEYSKKRDT